MQLVSWSYLLSTNVSGVYSVLTVQKLFVNYFSLSDINHSLNININVVLIL